MAFPLRQLLFLPLLSCLVACGGGSGSSSSLMPHSDFTLTVNPDRLSLPAGSSGQVTVTVSRLNGHSAPIQFKLVGLPSGITVTAGPLSAQNSAPITINVAATVAPQTLGNLTLQGESLALVHTIPFTLVVLPALPPNPYPVDLVQAVGGRQTGGNLENHAILGELIPPSTSANGNLQVRHGFTPSDPK